MNRLTAKLAQQKIRSLGNPQNAAIAARFFKTGPGEYGEGDRFVGVRVPVVRTVAKEFRSLPQAEVVKLLHSPIHEERLAALIVWTLQVARADEELRRDVYDQYLANTAHINSWDLVDVSAPQLVGAHLMEKSRRPLHRLAQSSSLWERRISIIATQHFIRQRDYGDTLAIAERLLTDEHDLIHKAVGWMLREVGKRDQATEEAFLEKHFRKMPRTMLRYAIERFSADKRSYFLK